MNTNEYSFIELQKPSSEKVMHIFENFIFLLLGGKFVIYCICDL